MRLDEFSAPPHIDGVFDDVERIRFVSFGFDLPQWQSNSFDVSKVIQSARLGEPDVTQNTRLGEPTVTQNTRLGKPNIVGK